MSAGGAERLRRSQSLLSVSISSPGSLIHRSLTSISRHRSTFTKTAVTASAFDHYFDTAWRRRSSDCPVLPRKSLCPRPRSRPSNLLSSVRLRSSQLQMHVVCLVVVTWSGRSCSETGLLPPRPTLAHLRPHMKHSMSISSVLSLSLIGEVLISPTETVRRKPGEVVCS
jgi:hypothetical protein